MTITGIPDDWAEFMDEIDAREKAKEEDEAEAQAIAEIEAEAVEEAERDN